MPANNTNKSLDKNTLQKIKQFTTSGKKDCTGVLVSQLQQVLRAIGFTEKQVNLNRKSLLGKR